MHDDTPVAWLRARLPKQPLGASAQRVLNYLVTNVTEAGYAKASEIASRANVSVSSVTRLAQQLGFDGWPDLQQQLRSRTLAHMSLVDVSEFHGVTDTPFQNALRRDAESLADALRSIDETTITAVAHTLQRAHRIVVTAMGSFAAVGQALSHNLLVAGYPALPLVDRASALANMTATLGPGDVLIVCSYWRHYRATVAAAVAAAKRGAHIVVLADYVPDALSHVAHETILIPAEGTSFFASLTVPMAVQQGIIATLARIEPERTKSAIETAESMWDALELLVDPREG